MDTEEWPRTAVVDRAAVVGKKAVAISLPRDSYVTIPGYGKHKLNSAYTRALDDAQHRLRAQGITGAGLMSRPAKPVAAC